MWQRIKRQLPYMDAWDIVSLVCWFLIFVIAVIVFFNAAAIGEGLERMIR